jgi:CHASE3 domain sensor protein
MEKKKLPPRKAINKKSTNGLAIGCVTLITVLAITLHVIISFFKDYWQ